MGRYAEYAAEIGVAIIAGAMAGGAVAVGCVAVGSVLAVTLISPAHGHESYPGQYAQYSPEQRGWFQSLKSPGHVPCCNTADGHTAEWMSGESETGYVVAVADADAPEGFDWVPVPKSALIEPNTSPDRATWVWYTDQDGVTVDDTGHRHHKWYIRCFVAGDGG
jgi:hypothetical protein